MEETKNAKKAKKASFEESMNRLSEVVAALENGTAPLDESLALYEEGISLIRSCSRMLEAAEKKVTLLSLQDDGSVSEEPFAAVSDAAKES